MLDFESSLPNQEVSDPLSLSSSKLIRIAKMRKSAVLIVICSILSICSSSRMRSVTSHSRNRRMAGENSTSVVSESKFKNLDDILVELNKRNSEELRKEYEEIEKQSVQGTYEAAKLPENLWKNRYVNDSLFAFDQSRVKLSRDDNGSDYINANYVDGYNQKNAFILTQGC
jgi:hypothetical protein